MEALQALNMHSESVPIRRSLKIAKYWLSLPTRYRNLICLSAASLLVYTMSSLSYLIQERDSASYLDLVLWATTLLSLALIAITLLADLAFKRLRLKTVGIGFAVLASSYIVVITALFMLGILVNALSGA